MAYRTVDTSPASTATADGFMRALRDNAAHPKRRSLQDFANTALKRAAGLWFVVAVIGQLTFAFYITVFYGRAAVRWDFLKWNKALEIGYVPGDTLGNIAVATHLALAVIIILSGALQLTPQIRKRAPSIHRWNGRAYLLTAFTLPIGGLYMIWIRGGTPGDLSQHLGTSIDGLLVMLCGAMALRFALARQFAVHRRWALRLFLVASGVWFQRLGVLLWIFLNNGPVGFDPKTGTGPFLTIAAFGQFMLPLAVLELYLHAKDGSGVAARLAMAASLLALTVAMGAGIVVVTTRMWLPRLYY